MSEILKLKKSNCKNCYKCIRHCPVKSIRIADNQAHIVSEECVLCGQCFVVCPQNAKEIRCDLAAAKALVASGDPVYVSLAPSFVANYHGFSFAALKSALLRLGVTDVEETALGATQVKTAYEQLLNENPGRVLISSCCHSVNLMIQKYYPEALPYLAEVLSPMLAHAKQIKAEHPGAKVIFIGPCISKKDEAERYPGLVDCVLTFEELTAWLGSENIPLEPQEDTQPGGKARLFPLTGGILRTMQLQPEQVTYLAVDGQENCMRALEDVLAGKLTGCFIEMSACVGSCIGGPVMEKAHHRPIADFMAVNRYATTEDFAVALPKAKQLHKSMPFISVNRQMPGSAAIDEILRKMGKTSPADELNCGSCGYNTCRDKAVAVFQGKADLTMCLPFLKDKAESFSDSIVQNTPNGILVLNESLEIQQINSAALKIMNLRAAADILGEPVVRILDPKNFLEVMDGQTKIRDKRVYLAEYQKYVEETIVYDRNYHIIICLMRDVTQEESERSKKEAISLHTVEITDKVIDKQMRVVQEIASLLGETAAETKIALTKLKASLNDET